jgi:hypothetical protein
MNKRQRIKQIDKQIEELRATMMAITDTILLLKDMKQDLLRTKEKDTEVQGSISGVLQQAYKDAITKEVAASSTTVTADGTVGMVRGVVNHLPDSELRSLPPDPDFPTQPRQGAWPFPRGK